LRHGDVTQPVTVAFAWSEGGLRLEIVNALRADAPREASAHRHGIPGMRERALLTGGSFAADVEGEQRFRVAAWIPGTPQANPTGPTSPGGRTR
jgi:signal transduction histidine kinase